MAKHAREFKKAKQRTSDIRQNGKHVKSNERRVRKMLQTILDFILYIPRKINNHFERCRNLEEENRKLKPEIRDRKNMAKRIIYKCDDYMKKNQAVSYAGFKDIKELANMFPNDTTNSL